MTLETIADKIQYCVDVIVKETPQEERLVKQILYAMLSGYTNRPINLAINAPSGEGKNYILNKVAEKFPVNDVRFLGGMTDKALFHRNGKLVIRNEMGQYDPLDDKLTHIDTQIQDKRSEILNSDDSILKKALTYQIKDLEKDKNELIRNAIKLIELSHTILIFLDTPSLTLFSGIMPLLSHDKYEVEYEYADTHNGIKTKTNVLRGFPAVIFAQAIDSSYHDRFPEIKRRFTFVNPKMDRVKYDAAINLMADKFGLPDFAYQAKIVSREQKNTAKTIIADIAEGMIYRSEMIDYDKNDVIIPFIDAVNKSLDRDKTFDMTTAKRLMNYLGILPLINFESRPRLQVRDSNDPMYIEISPIATFDDLKEAISLIELSNGTRPYIMEWYNEVYLPTYGTLVAPNSRLDNYGKMIYERTIGLNTKQLSDATLDIQKKVLSENQIRDTYLKPLVNENIIDKCSSECDKRSYITFPVITAKIDYVKEEKIHDYTKNDESCISYNLRTLKIRDFTTFPSKEYLNTWIQGILNYTIQNPKKEIKIISHENKELTVSELVEQYYQNVEDYFDSSNADNITSDIVEEMTNLEEKKGDKAEDNDLKDYDDNTTTDTKSKNEETRDTEQDKRIMQTCSKCGKEVEAFYMKLHKCDLSD